MPGGARGGGRGGSPGSPLLPRRRVLLILLSGPPRGAGQGVMVRSLPEVLYFVADAGDAHQTLRILPAATPPSRAQR